MKKDRKPEKDREATEKRLLEAVGELMSESGFEKLGVNAIAERAGVSKMLIYRYFGSIDELITQYIFSHDYWINVPLELPSLDELDDFLKQLFRRQIQLLRSDTLLKRLYRWELSAGKAAVDELRKKREENGMQLIRLASRLSGSPEKEVAAFASVISASISYLSMLEEVCPVYNGIELQADEGWEQLARGIDLIIDSWYKSIKNRK